VCRVALELRKPRNGRQIKAGRPKPNADGHPSAMADFCNKIGQERTRAPQQIAQLFP
jgi:hypothetical protein